jgi:hypothetical protein
MVGFGVPRNCSSATKKGAPCKYKVEDWRLADKCHIHDPNGIFRQQVKAGAHRKPKNKNKGHEHTWYMREDGITCTKCFLIWHKDQDINQ